jgi:hypothetical protein
MGDVDITAVLENLPWLEAAGILLVLALLARAPSAARRFLVKPGRQGARAACMGHTWRMEGVKQNGGRLPKRLAKVWLPHA